MCWSWDNIDWAATGSWAQVIVSGIAIAAGFLWVARPIREARNREVERQREEHYASINVATVLIRSALRRLAVSHDILSKEKNRDLRSLQKVAVTLQHEHDRLASFDASKLRTHLLITQFIEFQGLLLGAVDSVRNAAKSVESKSLGRAGWAYLLFELLDIREHLVRKWELLEEQLSHQSMPGELP